MPPPASAGVYTRIAFFSPYPRTASHKDAMAKLHPTISSSAVSRIADIYETTRSMESLTEALETLDPSTYLYVCTDFWMGSNDRVCHAALANKSFGLFLSHKIPGKVGETGLNKVFQINNKTIVLVWENTDPDGQTGVLK